MKCEKCGAKITADMMFCGECGHPVKNENIGSNCPKCGNPIATDDMFCGECGYKLEKVSTSEVIPHKEKEVPKPKESTPKAEIPVSNHHVGIKSTLPSRSEKTESAEKYNEGKKFLKPAGDFE